VTIATNMAGRGVDILLGGNPEGLARDALRGQGLELTEVTPEQWREALDKAKADCEAGRKIVLEAGGLFVLGTERHEARRIDNQLRGRAGRQGDPGETRFYLSLEDDLMRRFNGEQVKRFMSWANLPEDEPLEHSMVTKSIEQAQIRVEGHHFDIRKNVLEYDDVVNRQREIIYGRRREWLDKSPDELREDFLTLIESRIQEALADYDDNPDEDLLYQELWRIFPVPADITPDTLADMPREEMEDALVTAAEEALRQKEAQLVAVEPNLMARAQRLTMLQTIDSHWVRHLTALDMLREGIGLVSISQKDPKVEYKREGFQMFSEMEAQIAGQAARQIFMVQPAVTQVRRAPVRAVRPATTGEAEPAAQTVRNTRKLGRNDPCWCGSGKKYKNCHLREDEAKQKQHA
jgi:preprotein translocase subunit SecA